MKLEKLKTKIPFKKEKCNHDSFAGYWIVENSGEQYMFTGMNNNISRMDWILASKNKVEKENRIKMLRWVCKVCCTAQMP